MVKLWEYIQFIGGSELLMSVKIEMFPAKEGDSFLITLGENPKFNILIDGGLEDTYTDYLEKRLIELSGNNEQIDLLVVSHIDEDHILGILELLKKNGNSNNPQIIKIAEVWYNSYRHLEMERSKNSISEEERIILKSMITTMSSSRENENNESKDISGRQGSTLAALLYSGAYSWNTHLDMKAVNVDCKDIVQVNEKIKIRILSPNAKKLSRLRTVWKNQLNSYKLGFKLTDDKIFDDAFEFYMLSRPEIDSIDENRDISSKKVVSDLEILSKTNLEKDRSPTNGSSISFIIEYLNFKLLFLADSHSDIIIEKIKELIEKEDYLPNFDVIKVPHHGSGRNNPSELYELIDSENYLVSTDGMKNEHPDMATLAKIVTRDTLYTRKIYLNYPNPILSKINDEESKLKYKYDLKIPSSGESTIITLGETNEY
ncbi:MBL fold metallo-hydrolase [Paenibacillus sp. HWE-109]|uniref:AVAST type 1 anti-phage system MBL fold metallo-hydrolase Avs1a n=1 Tax=Paenibacillus sp. HWE-109 TaxID=1306526 RepID=UPI001EDFC4F3|nr:AVAST type 1 anti-phage system MBL fold metallo-hydrolase Avs1a [Paenibacillus sp. HWE-109]UKS29949.1 MBL fold metallo-hydrolase [Paenibacillus sp. HWE-109]